MKENIRVLLVSPLPPPIGGIASWTTKYMKWMKSKNYEIELVDTKIRQNRAKKANIRINIFKEMKRTFTIVSMLIKKIKNFKPNILHINTSCSKMGIIRDFLCVKIAEKHNIRIVTHYHCNIEDQLGKSKLSLRILNKLAKNSSVNIVLNSFSYEFLKKRTQNQIIVLPNFIDKNFINNSIKTINYEVKKICFTGHVKKAKGIVEIIEVAKLFPSIEFLVAGPIFEQLPKYSSTSSNLLFLGPLNEKEIRDLLSSSDIFLFPTHTEGFSTSLLEAMGMGLPIITTKVGANADMIERNGGYFVTVNSISDIKNKINSLKNIQKRISMSKWNINKVKSEYSIDVVLSRMYNIYSDLIG